jgi:hypothetical protein
VPELNTTVLLGAEHYDSGHVTVVPALWQEGADGGGLNLSEQRGWKMADGQGIRHAGEIDGVVESPTFFLVERAGG